MTTQLTSSHDERVLASLANASVLISLFTGFGGAIAAAIIWATQKDKSQYVAFQALQATAYQLIGALVFGLAWCCWLGFYFASWIPMIPQLEQNPDTLPPLFWIGMFSMVCPMLVMGAWTLYGLWGALETYRGKDFRYVVIGNWVKRSMMSSQAAG
ncbi:MAG: DUF4870 domain-containing protein [Caldilineae bacterium]|nr:DUF4870 domain-containing protein [Anaerolineae bacterium]MCB9143595.1 DUF4870 domain-containing protein [Anaerolineales bacterium]MCB9155146.1 DUF4870 domain-containing protein [Caldilineae bacterium]MCB0198659.1 DUF4870 domain-containing protein [Anaerolineae bacterium]MCB0204391.1 DUF4870 domain-containing protein [Anaerolineae bacterium]